MSVRSINDIKRDQARLDELGEQLDNADLRDDENAIKIEIKNLDRVSYDRQREELAQRHSIRTATLDKLYKDCLKATDEASGGTLEIGDVEPWADPVDGAALLDELESTFTQFTSLPDGGAIACALWAVHTHAHDAAVVSPLLAITSATKRCGKSTLLRLVGCLTRRPLPAANITSAALFRSIEKWRPTLLIDEADTFIRDSDELRGVLNSGHQKGGSVIRTVGDEHEPRIFSTWAPKAVALIGHLPDTLADRSIEIGMRRRRPGEHIERLRIGTTFYPMPEKMARWAQDHDQALKDCDIEPPSSLNDRAADNWRPLLAIAEQAGGNWPQKALAALHALEEQDDEEGVAVMLLADIKTLFEKRDDNRITSKGLAGYLETLEDRPWPEWRQGKPITPRQIAKQLSAFAINPKLIRLGDEVARGYERADFKDTFSRYFPDSSVTTLQPLQDKAYSDYQSVTRGESVTDEKSSKPLAHKACNSVTDKSPPRWSDEPEEEL